MNKDWEQIRELLCTSTKMPKEIIDIISSDEILSLCAFGYDAGIISVVLNVKESEVITTINQYFNFDGFSKKLPFNPIKYYKLADGDSYSYIDRVCSEFPEISDGDLKMSYHVAKEYTKLKERVDAYYANPSS